MKALNCALRDSDLTHARNTAVQLRCLLQMRRQSAIAPTGACSSATLPASDGPFVIHVYSSADRADIDPIK